MIRICTLVSVILLLLFFVCVKNGENYNTLLNKLLLNNKNWDENVNKKNKLQEFGHSLRKYVDVLIGPMVLGATIYIMHAIVSWGVSQLHKKHGESENQINVDVSLTLQRDVDKRVLNLEKRISHLEHHYSLVSTESILTEDHLKEEYSHSKSALLQISMEKLNSNIMQSTSDLHSPCSFSEEPLRIFEIDSSNYTLRPQQNSTKNTVRYTNKGTRQFDCIAVTLNDPSRDMKFIESTDIHKSINDSEILLSITDLEVTNTTVLNKSSNNCTGKTDYSENQSNQNQDDFLERFTVNKHKQNNNSKQIATAADASCRKTSREKYCKPLPEEKLEYLVNDFLDSEQCTTLLQDESERNSRITVMASDKKEHNLLSNSQLNKKSSETLIVDAICQVEIDVLSSDIEINKICNLSSDTKHENNALVLEDRNKHLNNIGAGHSKPDSDNSTGRGRTNQRRCISHYQKRYKEKYASNNPKLSCKEDSIERKSSETHNKTGSLDKPSIETVMPERNGPNRRKQSIAANNNIKIISDGQHNKKNKK